MIKIFRKIKQNMLTENKFSKYILYAIGEIILVVIGILIALQINNWNQIKTDRKVEQQYISSLIEDAKTDLSNFKNAITLNEKRINSLDSLIYRCYNYNTKNKKDPELIMWYINSIVRPDFVLQTDRTLSQLKNSGGMRLIEDKTKINAIVTYEESFERLYNQQVWYEDGLKNLLNAGVPVFNYKYIQLYIQLSEKNFDLDLETFIRTARLLNTNNNLIIELGNRASLYSIITYSYLNYLEAGKQDCLKLIDILENKNTTVQKNK
jgi:hypothetical protein